MTRSFVFDVIPRQALNLEVFFLSDVRDCLKCIHLLSLFGNDISSAGMGRNKLRRISCYYFSSCF